MTRQLPLTPKATFILNFLANVCPVFAPFHAAKYVTSAAPYLAHVLRGFTALSVAAVVVWANMRLVKTAWAVGAL